MTRFLHFSCFAIALLFATTGAQAQALRQSLDPDRPSDADGGLAEILESSQRGSRNASSLRTSAALLILDAEIESALQVNGILSAERFAAMENFALAARAANELERAASTFERLLSLKRTRFDPTDRRVLVTLNDYAMVLDDLGQDFAAEEIYLELLELT